MNNTKKIVLTLAGIFTTTLSTQIFAVCSLASGVYVQGDIGMSRTTGKTYTNSSSVQNYGKGWGVEVGYKFTPFFAVEGGYIRYASTRIKNSSGTTAAQDSHYSVDIAAKLIAPFKNSGLELFAKLGVAQLVSKIGSIDPSAAAVNNMTFTTGNMTTIGAFGAIGAQFFFTPSFAGVVQYSGTKGNSNTGNMQLASVGLALLF